MGDNITDLPSEPGIPPVPPKTYQWEDIRRQKLEGRYPWTHVYKPPFDEETYQKSKDHEYEPVIPMDSRKTPPPFVKITTEVEHKAERREEEQIQDKHHLCIPQNDMDGDEEEEEEEENVYEEQDDDDDDDTEEITAAELQNRLEEKYFQQSPGSSKHDYEVPETRSVSPAITDDLSRDSSSFQDKVHSQTDKIKQKFKTLKEQISKDVDSSPRFKRKKDEAGKPKPVKKNKFNFRKHTKQSERSDFNIPQAPRFSFSSLSSFSRSRSNSVKERERKRSQSSESDSQKKKFDFNFSTYPRIFRRNKSENKLDTPNTPRLKPKSVPSSPSLRRSPFPQRWISKFTSDHKKEDEKKEEKKLEPKKQKIVQESIFISLHDDTKIPQETVTSSTSIPESQPPTSESDYKPLSQKIDNKNFIFISLHEERFPEKLEKPQTDEHSSDAETESELRKVETARKFTNLLRRLETDRKLKSTRFAGRKTADDKPEPVTITEIGNDDEGDLGSSTVNLEDSVETPEDTSEETHLPRVESAKIIQENKYDESDAENLAKPPTSEGQKEEVSASNVEAEQQSTHITKPEPFVPDSKPLPPKAPSEPKEPSKFLKIKEILKEKEKLLKPSPPANETKEKETKKFSTLPQQKESKNYTSEPKEKESKKFFTQPREKESKKFSEFKENLLKETEKIGTLKNKIKNYFTKDSDTANDKLDNEDKHIYEEFDNVETTPPESRKKREDDQTNPPVPQKTPRKKLKKLDSDKESKESLSAFEDPALNDIITLDEQQPMTKTYINASLQEVHDVPVEPEHTTKHFKNYEKALEKSRSYSSIEIENNQYSTNNTLARLETPVPPARPSRTRSLQRTKRAKPIAEENKENDYDNEPNPNYNTFPMIKPDKPRRKFRKRRTYSNSTNNTDVKSVNEMEDAAISNNIANSKQLSVSFLPLTSNIVGEPLLNYNLRETSSMIHLNLNSEPPLPPKRRKSTAKDAAGNYNSLPNGKYSSKTSSKTSLTVLKTCNGIHADAEDFEYVDDANSIAPSDSPPHRPNRKRSAGPSLIDDDRTSREIDSLPSEKSFCDSDSKDINGYAVIKPAHKSHSQPTAVSSNTTPRRKSRRLSDFFTLPRIRTPTNYVSPAPAADYERRVSPSRPPRRSRQYNEPFYTNEENINATIDTNFGDEEELNFNLAVGAEDDDIQEIVEKDEKNLQTDEVMERMKIRPLPPPPRPTRKPKDYESNDPHCDYSQVKKNTENKTNNLNQESSELKIINTNVLEREPTGSKIIDKTKPQDIAVTNPQPEPECSNTIEDHPVVRPTPEPEQTHTIKNTEFQDLSVAKPSTSSTLNVITAQKLNVSELNVAKLSISEIESSKITTSNLDSTTLQVSDVRTDAGHLIINSVHLTSSAERLSPVLHEPHSPLDNVDSSSTRDVTPSSAELLARSRISSMIPEVGSDEESTSTVTKVVRPNRRKSAKKEEPSTSSVVSGTNQQPTLAELMCQILQICHSSVGQAIHSLLEQIIPEDREKRNEVQAAIWVITIIVAGCLMLGLQSNEKIVHHHHWDFHFPPPH